jgi:hypothetical protein
MTTRARKVLEDCKIAYRELLETLEGKRGTQGRKEFVQRISKGLDSEELQSERRIRWVTVLVLLSSVEDALEKDKREFTGKCEIVDEAISDLENEIIYSDFIKEQRNNIVHQYEFAVGEVKISTAEFTIPFLSRDGEEFTFRMPTGISYPITHGTYSGRDQTEIVSEAISFWDKFLTKVEKKIQAAARLKNS